MARTPPSKALKASSQLPGVISFSREFQKAFSIHMSALKLYRSLSDLPMTSVVSLK
jgi:hypothetical protein